MLYQLTTDGERVPVAGSCLRCGRALTDPVSIRRGYGPVCAGYIRSTYPVEAGGDRYDLEFNGDIVCQRDADGTKHFNIAPIVTSHSPSGFEWGYHGSGPSDFALNILHAFTVGEEPADIQVYRGKTTRTAYRHYHEFKRQFIAALPESGGVIPGWAIREWIKAQRAAEDAMVRQIIDQYREREDAHV